MTQKSYLWDGTVTGDAFYAPYNAEEFNRFMFMPVAQDLGTEAYVIPGYLDDLFCTWLGEGVDGVFINAGAAIVKNFLFIMDKALSLPLEKPTLGKSRYVYIVLRYVTIDFEGQEANTVRIKTHEGVEQSNMSSVPPTLQQDSSVWEVPLALVWVNNTVTYANTTNTTVDYSDVVDKRKFIYNTVSGSSQSSTKNLLANSEWMSVDSSPRPQLWSLYEGTATITHTAISVLLYDYDATRGSVINYTPSASIISGIQQRIRLGGAQQTFTVKGRLGSTGTINDGQTSVMLLGITDDGRTLDDYLHQRLRHYSGSDYEVSATFTFSEPVVRVTYIIYVEGTTNTVTHHAQSLCAGYFADIHDCRLTSLVYADNDEMAAWLETAKSTGTTTINLSPADILFQTNAVAYMLRVRARDSASAAGGGLLVRILGNPTLAAGMGTEPDYGTLYLDGVPNDEWREINVIIPVTREREKLGTLIANSFRIQVVASGALTCDVLVSFRGIIA